MSLPVDADGRAPLPGQLTIAGDIVAEVLPAGEVLPAQGSLAAIASRVAGSQASKASRKAYASSYRRLARVVPMAVAGPEALTAELAIAFRDHLEDDGLAPASIARHMSALRELARAAGAGREVLEVRSPKVPPGQPRPLTPEQAVRLLVMPDRRTTIGLRDAAVLHLMLGAGLRAGEVVALDAEDLSERARLSNGALRPAIPNATRWIASVRGKGGTSRQVPLSESVADALGRWGRVRPASRSKALVLSVHRSRPADRLSTAAISDIVAKHAAAADLPGVTPHVLRHTFASRLGEAKVQLDTIAKLLGHQDLRTSLVYARRAASADEDAIDAINAQPTGLDDLAGRIT